MTKKIQSGTKRLVAELLGVPEHLVKNSTAGLKLKSEVPIERKEDASAGRPPRNFYRPDDLIVISVAALFGPGLSPEQRAELPEVLTGRARREWLRWAQKHRRPGQVFVFACPGSDQIFFGPPEEWELWARQFEETCVIPRRVDVGEVAMVLHDRYNALPDNHELVVKHSFAESDAD